MHPQAYTVSSQGQNKKELILNLSNMLPGALCTLTFSSVSPPKPLEHLKAGWPVDLNSKPYCEFGIRFDPAYDSSPWSLHGGFCEQVPRLCSALQVTCIEPSVKVRHIHPYPGQLASGSRGTKEWIRTVVPMSSPMRIW